MNYLNLINNGYKGFTKLGLLRANKILNFYSETPIKFSNEAVPNNVAATLLVESARKTQNPFLDTKELPFQFEEDQLIWFIYTDGFSYIGNTINLLDQKRCMVDVNFVFDVKTGNLRQNSYFHKKPVSLDNFYFVFPENEDYNEIIQESTELMEKAQSKIRQIWKNMENQNRKKNIQHPFEEVKTEEIAHLLFPGKDLTPSIILATKRLLLCKDFWFTRNFGHHFQTVPAKLMKEKEKRNNTLRNHELRSRFLEELSKKLPEERKQRYELYKENGKKFQTDPINYDTSKPLSSDISNQFIKLLEEYFATPNTGLLNVSVFLNLLRPFGLKPERGSVYKLLTESGHWKPYDSVIEVSSEDVIVGARNMTKHEIPNSRGISSFPFEKPIETNIGVVQNSKKRVTIPDSMVCYAIDSSDTFEVDDAVSLEIKSDNKEWIHIHISDPTSYFSHESDIFNIAGLSTTSFYGRNQTSFMLPLESIKKSTLKNERLNNSLTFSVQLNEDGSIGEYEIVETELTNLKRLNYEQVDSILEIDSKNYINSSNFDMESSDIQTLNRLYKIAEKRKQYRKECGSHDFNWQDFEVKFNENNEPFIIPDKMDKSRILVQELMLLCGNISSTFASKNSLAVCFRAQETVDVQGILKNIKDHEILKSWALLTNMQPSYYSSFPEPHFSVGFEHYARSSSPLRRYTDLVTHYQLKSILHDTKAPFTNFEIEEIGKKNLAIERYFKKLQNRTFSFNLLCYLHFEGPEKKYEAVIVEKNEKSTFVIVTDLYKTASIKQNPITHEVGSIIKVKARVILPFFVDWTEVS